LQFLEKRWRLIKYGRIFEIWRRKVEVPKKGSKHEYWDICGVGFEFGKATPDFVVLSCVVLLTRRFAASLLQFGKATRDFVVLSCWTSYAYLREPNIKRLVAD